MLTKKDSTILDRLNQWRHRPLTVSAAANEVFAALGADQRAALRNSSFSHLDRFDYCLGVIVRTRLELWAEGRVVDQNGVTVTCPDAAARLVIQELWLQEQEHYILTHPTTLAATVFTSESTWGPVGGTGA